MANSSQLHRASAGVLTLTLFEFRVLFVDYVELALATDDLTVNRTLLDGWFDLHNAGEIRLVIFVYWLVFSNLLVSVNDPSAG